MLSYAFRFFYVVRQHVRVPLAPLAQAERHFLEAMGLGHRDVYLLAAYADFLLDQGRYADVARLLRAETRVDGLLLRVALAEHALGLDTRREGNESQGAL